MPDEFQAVGIVIAALAAIGGFVATVFRFMDRMNKPVQAINEAIEAINKTLDRVDTAVQLLNQAVGALNEKNDIVSHRLNEHGRQIDELKIDLATIKERVSGNAS